MTATEHRRIDALSDLITEALDEPAPSVEDIAARRLFNRLSRKGQRAALAQWALEDSVAMLKAHEAQDAPFDLEINAAKRWKLDMGRAARIPKGGA